MKNFSIVVYVVSKLPSGGRFHEPDPKPVEILSDKDGDRDDYAWLRKPERPPEYLCFPEERIQRRGGLEGVEHDLGETCRWFSRLGQIQIPRIRRGRIRLPLNVIQHLIDGWVAQGSPKKEGWWVRHVKLNREVEHALTEDARRSQSTNAQHEVVAYEILRTEPVVHKIPGVLDRLDLGETVQVDLTVHMSCVGRHGSSIWLRRDKYVRQLWLWRDEGDDQFKVHVGIPNETHGHPN